jgi:hypothetical protein
MKELEKRITRLSPDPRTPDADLPAPDPAPPSCKLRIENFHPEAGTFGFILNGHFIGAVGSPETRDLLEYSCGFLKNGLNLLEVRSLGLRIRGTIGHEPFQFTPLPWTGTVSELQLQNFSRPDGSYQGSRLDFNYGHP